MKDNTTKLQALLNYLDKAGIQMSRVCEDSMRNRAVAKFAFDLGVPASILCGQFEDKIRELASIAHEAGHVVVYQKMNLEETRNYICIMFAVNKMGIGRVAPDAQAYVLKLEAEASATGLDILRKIGIDKGELNFLKELMAKWFASYEDQCHKDVVEKVRGQMIQQKNPRQA